MHLPPRAVVKLELSQRFGVPLPLAGQHCRDRAVKSSKCFVPLAVQDLLSELSTGCHGRSSPQTFRKVRA